jgi:hypothetical protein
MLAGLMDRIGGSSFRLDDRKTAVRRATRFLARHGGFFTTRVLPRLFQLLRRTRTVRANYFCIVSHHFMSRTELDSPLGQERLDACAFKVPINGRLESMCAVNSLGIRASVYDTAREEALVSA